MSRSLSKTPGILGQRAPIKMMGHQERLVNSKRVFDQLHRKKAKSFAICNYNLYPQEVEKLQKRNHEVSQQSELPSFFLKNSSRESTYKISNSPLASKRIYDRSGSQNMKIQNLSNTRSKLSHADLDQNKKQYLSSRFPTMNQSPNLFNKQSGGSFMTENQSASKEKEAAGKRWKKSGSLDKEEGFLRTSNLQLNTQFRSDRVHKSKERNIINQKVISLKPSNLSNGGLSILSYIKFIEAPEGTCELHIHFNFEDIRKMSSKEAWIMLDMRNARMIESIFESMLHVKILLFRKSLQDHQINPESIKDYCWLYFNNYEKARMQMVLKQHYFKLFAFKLNPIFVYQRIALYFCYLLSESKCIIQPWYFSKAKQIISLLRDIYSVILKMVKQIEETKPTIQTILSAQNRMDSTFQILRAVSQMEKNIGNLIQSVQQIVEFSKQKELGHIYRTLSHFVADQAFGAGNSTYENFIKTEMMLSWKYLQLPPTPFLPLINPCYSFTILLDLDQTLIYYNQDTKLLKFRPFLDTFFKQAQALKFQLISFSATTKSYADTIINQLERKGRIFQYRLYKDHLSLHKGRLVKDIRRVGRDMSKILIVDDLALNFISNICNGIEVSSWHGGKQDRQLLSLITLLTKLKSSQLDQPGEDVRQFVKKHKKTIEKFLQSCEQSLIVQQNSISHDT